MAVHTNIHKAFKAMAKIASTDDSRPILTTLRLEQGEHAVKVTATDSYVLAELEVEMLIEGLPVWDSILIPAKFMAEATKAEAVSFTLADGELTASGASVTMTSRVMNAAEYPGVDSLWPTDVTPAAIPFSLPGHHLAQVCAWAKLIGVKDSPISFAGTHGEKGSDQQLRPMAATCSPTSDIVNPRILIMPARCK